MAYFCATDEVVIIKPTQGREAFVTPDQLRDMQDDAAIESSSNVIVTNQLRVACNGDGGTLGHPQIFLTLGNDGRVTCPYCSREFVKSAD